MSNLNIILGTDIGFKDDVFPSASGDISTLSGLDNLKQALWRRLITVPGSLVHRPDYGVGVKQFQNAPGSLTMFQRLANKIQEQFVQDPRVASVLSLSIRPDDNNPALILLYISVDVVGYGELALQYTPFSEGV